MSAAQPTVSEQDKGPVAPKQKPATPVAGPTLPNMSEWAGYTPAKPNPDIDLGTVIGLDYSKWAVFLIDLKQTEGRIAAQRAKAAEKGYKLASGFSVVGWSKPEVWVKPRALEQQAMRVKREELVKSVNARRVSKYALMRPHVKRFNETGESIDYYET